MVRIALDNLAARVIGTDSAIAKSCTLLESGDFRLQAKSSRVERGGFSPLQAERVSLRVIRCEENVSKICRQLRA